MSHPISRRYRRCKRPRASEEALQALRCAPTQLRARAGELRARKVHNPRQVVSRRPCRSTASRARELGLREEVEGAQEARGTLEHRAQLTRQLGSRRGGCRPRSISDRSQGAAGCCGEESESLSAIALLLLVNSDRHGLHWRLGLPQLSGRPRRHYIGRGIVLRRRSRRRRHR